MTVAKQPAVYTHTCDRCKTTTTSDDGALPGVLRWSRLGASDLCGQCSDAFQAFMRSKPSRFCAFGECDQTPDVYVQRGVRSGRELRAVCSAHARELIDSHGWTAGVS